ncbi:Uncharacterised protein [Streptococcus pyogenes]|uniref:hypothetical protein n=1 Tax=Streptococcus pyogenes TaxID=1314 RepID=UPI00109C76B1|nr:hypothetical protein [Streptococcus pyogenes]VHD72661.1 Uncharacterised protein [Streptococcus pyogenes]
MNKKFLKSVAIVGLASTALGMTQSVGAVVVNRNEDAISEIHNVINQVNKTASKIKDSEHFDNLLKHSHNNIIIRFPLN